MAKSMLKQTINFILCEIQISDEIKGERLLESFKSLLSINAFGE